MDDIAQAYAKTQALFAQGHYRVARDMAHSALDVLDNDPAWPTADANLLHRAFFNLMLARLAAQRDAADSAYHYCLAASSAVSSMGVGTQGDEVKRRTVAVVEYNLMLCRMALGHTSIIRNQLEAVLHKFNALPISTDPAGPLGWQRTMLLLAQWQLAHAPASIMLLDALREVHNQSLMGIQRRQAIVAVYIMARMCDAMSFFDEAEVWWDTLRAYCFKLRPSPRAAWFACKLRWGKPPVPLMDVKHFFI